jgi:hypothetical protein
MSRIVRRVALPPKPRASIEDRSAAFAHLLGDEYSADGGLTRDLI